MPVKGKVRLTMRSGDPGTRRFAAEYGDKLVAVRYRYDRERSRRYTTVELVVAESEWRPDAPSPDPDRQVAVRIGYEEETLRRRVRDAGGRWDPRSRVWWLRFALAAHLGLEPRIVSPQRDQISTSR